MINFVESTQAGARQATPQDLDDAFAEVRQYVDDKVAGVPAGSAGGSTGATGVVDPSAVSSAISTALTALATSNAAFYSDPTKIDPTGVKDSTAGLQDPIDRAAAAGGGVVVWPAGKFRITAPIKNTTSGVRIIGAGRGAFHDTAPYVQAGTTLIWYGPVGGTMLSVGAAQSAVAQKLTNADVLGIALEGTPDLVTAGADYGLVLTSVQHSEFDIQSAEFNVAAVAMTVGVALNEAANCEGNTLSLRFRQENLAGTALQLGGSAVGNTCFNEFPIVFGYTNKGIGVDLQNCDNNRFGRVWIDRISGGTGTNVYFRSDAQFGGKGACARVNNIADLSFSIHAGFIYAEGTEAAGAMTPSFSNTVQRFDLANALPTVVYGTGSSLFMSWNTSPIGLRDSNIKQYSGYYQLSSGLVEFWNTTGNLGAGTTSTFTMEFACTRILEVSAQPLGNNNASGQMSCFNYDASNRTDGASNRFDLYSPNGGYATYRGRALAPI